MIYESNSDGYNSACSKTDNLSVNMAGLIILDTGASCHMFNTNNLMTEYRTIDSNTFKITGFNGSIESATGMGNIGILKNVLYIKNIPNSIISTT